MDEKPATSARRLDTASLPAIGGTTILLSAWMPWFKYGSSVWTNGFDIPFGIGTDALWPGFGVGYPLLGLGSLVIALSMTSKAPNLRRVAAGVAALGAIGVTLWILSEAMGQGWGLLESLRIIGMGELAAIAGGALAALRP